MPSRQAQECFGQQRICYPKGIASSSPRVARHALPWVADEWDFNPNGVASRRRTRGATPLGLWVSGPVAQGCAYRATLGFEPKSLWDSSDEFPKGIRVQAKLRKEIATRKGAFQFLAACFLQRPWGVWESNGVATEGSPRRESWVR